MEVWGVEMNLNPIIIQRDPKFRVFIDNGLFEGRNKGRDKRRHADTNDDTKIPNQKVLSE